MDALFPGTEVLARGLRWEVVDVEPAGAQTRYRLRPLSDAVRQIVGEIDLLSPLETVEPVARELVPERAANLAQWRLYHQAFLLEQALGSSALLAAKPGRLVPAPYQLVPLMRTLRMSRPRILLADAVGLGKTIQAGLIMAEMIARRRAHRILIVTPAGPLMEQWRTEMRERFGLRFCVLDRDRLQQIRYEQELGANPFDYEALGLISIDFAKQERVLQDLERTQYDMVVIDEAHHCFSMGDAGDREDSQRRQLAEVLARRADGLLMLTATPHDGYDAHFASLMELLDPSLVDGRGSLRGDGYRNYVVRRLKRHIKKPGTNEPMFRERHVTPIPVDFDDRATPAFTEFQRALAATIAPQLKAAVRQRRFENVLAFLALLKRSVSTVAAARKTLEAVSSRFSESARSGDAAEARRQRIRTVLQYRKRMERFGALSSEEERDLAELEAEDIAAELREGDSETLLKLLTEITKQNRRENRKVTQLKNASDALAALIELGEAAETEDPKLAALLEQIREIRRAEPNANVLVYTEYADSQVAAVASLEAALKRKKLDGTIIAISGLDDDRARIAKVDRFKREDGLVLVSTDATSEGLDLHTNCHHLVHLELPYNPNRLEQRNGRIDRFGQKHDPIVRYLYLTGTFEERLLLRLVAKYEQQRKRLTFVPNTLGPIVGDPTGAKLLAGLAEDDLVLFKRGAKQISFDAEAEADDTDSKAYRELLSDIDRAHAGFKSAAKTHAWLGEQGLHAEENSVEQAEKATAAGARAGGTDIVEFVLDALRSEMGVANVKHRKDGTWEVKVPSAWKPELEDLPGWDAEADMLRFTAKLDQFVDGDKRPVGFLGRAHPLVRRALDRVRNVQLGSKKDALDRRVSVAANDRNAHEVLFTFVGRVQSVAGREFERVVAVRAGEKGTAQPLADHIEWAPLADPTRGVSTHGVWKSAFASWVAKREPEAERVASAAFAKLAEAFRAEHEYEVRTERDSMEKWLRQRSADLCGAAPVARQADLFNKAPAARPWETMQHGLDRLTAFATDKSEPVQRRSEAETVVRLYKQRVELLDRRAKLTPPMVTPLGMLLLLPVN